MHPIGIMICRVRRMCLMVFLACKVSNSFGSRCLEKSNKNECYQLVENDDFIYHGKIRETAPQTHKSQILGGFYKKTLFCCYWSHGTTKNNTNPRCPQQSHRQVTVPIQVPKRSTSWNLGKKWRGGDKEKSANAVDNWLVVSTHLKNISQIGNLPQVGVKKIPVYIFETTT